MPAVLVHGIPDTHRVWNRVLSHLKRNDVIALDLPGFGVPVPDDLVITADNYVDWIIAQIEAIGEPVDLVGHDFGCILTARVASLRPDLIRSWVGVSGPIDPEYEPHAFAKACMTPGVGETMMAQVADEDWVPQFVAAGVPEQEAVSTVSFMDDTMKDAILKLYRTQFDVTNQWYAELGGATSRSMIVWGIEDEFLPDRFADRLGEATSSEAVIKYRTGHWVPIVKPEELVQTLEAFWR